MDELGSILREAREMKGLTLAEVENRIRINARFLDALETGDYTALPTPVHVRGFLRNYARFLDLEPAPLLARVDANLLQEAQSSPKPNRSEKPSPQEVLQPRVDQPFFDPVNMSLAGQNDDGGTESTVRIVIILALLATIVLAASRFVPLFLGRGDGQDNLPAVIESLLAGDNEAEVQAEPAAIEDEAPATLEPILPTGRNNPAAVVTDTVPVPTPTRPLLPATLESIHMELDITERTWIRVTIDGEVVFEDQVTTENGPLEWDAEQEAHLLTGNAAGVFVTINGTPLGKLGDRGEVADESWVATGAP